MHIAIMPRSGIPYATVMTSHRVNRKVIKKVRFLKPEAAKI